MVIACILNNSYLYSIKNEWHLKLFCVTTGALLYVAGLIFPLREMLGIEICLDD